MSKSDSKSKQGEINAKVNIEKVNKAYQESKIKAKKLMNDPDKALDTTKKAMEKAEKVKGPLEKVWSYLQLMFSLIKDYFKGNYKKVPAGSIITILAGIIYFWSPIDVIPDFIPFIGYIDDVFVLSIVFAQVQTDLENYKVWKDSLS